jgi:glutathione S-transferase
VWLLEELNLEYELKIFKRNKDFRAGDDLRAVHPLGKSPLIGITPAGAEKEIVIAESATIVEYVCEHFGRHMIPQRYPEGKEGVLGAENEDFMRYRVRISLSCLWLLQAISFGPFNRQLRRCTMLMTSIGPHILPCDPGTSLRYS